MATNTLPIRLQLDGTGCHQPVPSWWPEIFSRNATIPCILTADKAAGNGIAIFRAHWAEFPDTSASSLSPTSIFVYTREQKSWQSLDAMIAAGLTDSAFWDEAAAALRPSLTAENTPNYIILDSEYIVAGVILPRIAHTTILHVNKSRRIRISADSGAAKHLISRRWVLFRPEQINLSASVQHHWRLKSTSLKAFASGFVSFLPRFSSGASNVQLYRTSFGFDSSSGQNVASSQNASNSLATPSMATSPAGYDWDAPSAIRPYLRTDSGKNLLVPDPSTGTHWGTYEDFMRLSKKSGSPPFLYVNYAISREDCAGASPLSEVKESLLNQARYTNSTYSALSSFFSQTGIHARLKGEKLTHLSIARATSGTEVNNFTEAPAPSTESLTINGTAYTLTRQPGIYGNAIYHEYAESLLPSLFDASDSTNEVQLVIKVTIPSVFIGSIGTLGATITLTGGGSPSDFILTNGEKTYTTSDGTFTIPLQDLIPDPYEGEHLVTLSLRNNYSPGLPESIDFDGELDGTEQEIIILPE